MSLILVIDDEPQIRQLMDALMDYEGHTTLIARDGREGLELLGKDVDLVVTDLLMPNKEGLETIADIRRAGWGVPVIAMSGGGIVGPNSYLETARLIGANAVLPKPFTQDEMLATVRSLLEVSVAC